MGKHARAAEKVVDPVVAGKRGGEALCRDSLAPVMRTMGRLWLLMGYRDNDGRYYELAVRPNYASTS
jgi:hypothetical protein